MIKSINYGLYVFGGGFALYSLCRYISSYKPSLSKDQFTKLLNKIRNLTIHLMIQRYDSNNKLVNQIKDDSEPEISDTSKSPIANIKLPPDEFNTEAEQMVIEVELRKLKQSHLTIQEYNDYLTTYINDPSVIKIISTIQTTMNSLQQNLIPKFSLGEVIPVKYLEIISNIFYLNMRKTTREYYKEQELLTNQKSFRERNTIFNMFYNQKLRETRGEVVKYFKVEENEIDLSPKLSLRVYSFYYEKKHPFRLAYNQINDDVNDLIVFILNSPKKIEEFINDKHKDAICSPVDKVIDFKHFIQNENKSLLLKQENYEDQYD